MNKTQLHNNTNIRHISKGSQNARKSYFKLIKNTLAHDFTPWGKINEAYSTYPLLPSRTRQYTTIASCCRQCCRWVVADWDEKDLFLATTFYIPAALPYFFISVWQWDYMCFIFFANFFMQKKNEFQKVVPQQCSRCLP
jgi:hypothetical protein